MAAKESIDGIVECLQGLFSGKAGLKRLLETVVNIGITGASVGRGSAEPGSPSACHTQIGLRRRGEQQQTISPRVFPAMLIKRYVSVLAAIAFVAGVSAGRSGKSGGGRVYFGGEPFP